MAVTYSQSLLVKGPGRVGELRGAVANHYLILWPAASFARSLSITFGGIWLSPILYASGSQTVRRDALVRSLDYTMRLNFNHNFVSFFAKMNGFN